MAKLFKGDFGDLIKAVTVQDVGDGIAHIEHEKPETAMLLIGAGTFGVVRVAHASDWRERPIDKTHDFTH